MINIQLLENDDVILETDYIRQLNLIYEGQSDYLQTRICYSGTPINRLGWIKVQTICPYFIGKTLGELRKKLKTCDYEVIRGKLPDNHLESL